MSHYIYDNRTLYIRCDCASAEQIYNSFKEALTTYQKLCPDLDCRFRVNLVETREGKSLGKAFVFVTDPRVYHVLLGRNPDGSDRIEYRDDPSWSPPSDGNVSNDAGWSTISTPVSVLKMDWANDEEVEEVKFISNTSNKQVCPKIPVPLDPLVTLPPYKLSSKQIEEKRAKIIADNQGKLDFDPSKINISETAHFIVDRALAHSVDDKYMPNILKSKNVPDWITKDDLKIQFAPYATKSDAVHDRIIKGHQTKESYPFVNINEDRVAFIIFDPSTNDALFALHMMMKTFMSKEMPNGTVNNVTLLFGHSYRTDRDLVSSAIQKPKPYPKDSRDTNRNPKHRSENKRIIKNYPKKKENNSSEHHVKNRYSVLRDPALIN